MSCALDIDLPVAMPNTSSPEKIKALFRNRNEAHQVELRSGFLPIDILEGQEFLADGVTPDDFRRAALLSEIAYSVESPQDLLDTMRTKFEIPSLNDGIEAGMLFDCGFVSNPLSKDELPAIFVVIYSKSRDKRKFKWNAELYFGFRGTAEALDWATNLDARPTASQCPSLRLHSGMFGVYNTVKERLEEIMERVADTTLEGVAVELDKVVFTGHSLGGGVAQICNFQAWAANTASHWPSTADFRPATPEGVPMFALTFAAPPVCFAVTDVDAEESGDEISEIDPGSGDGKIQKAAQRHSCNCIMEFDIVPRLAYTSFVLQALESQAMASQGKAAVAVASLASRLTPFSEGLADLIASTRRQMSKLFHNSNLCVFAAMLHPQLSWRLLLLQNRKDMHDFLKTPWPFRGEPSGLPLTDHSVLPSQLAKEWRHDHCKKSFVDQDCDEMKDDECNFVDCKSCSMTFCKGCFAKRSDTLCKFHFCSERGLDECGVMCRVQRGSDFNMIVEKDVAAVLKDMNSFFFALQREANAGHIGAVNIFFMADMTAGVLQAALHSSLSSMSTAIGHVSGTDLIIAAGIGAVRSGALMYQFLYTGEIDAHVFWANITVVWMETAGAIGGAALGAWVGGAIGAMLGPFGAVIGAILGSAIGGLIGRAVGAAAAKTFIEWLQGQTPETKHRVKLMMILQAMMNFEMQDHIPSQLELREVRRQYKLKALQDHPDKTGLTGRTDLTPAEEERYKKKIEAFKQIQHDCDVLEAFIRERKDRFSPADLMWMDETMPSFAEKHRQIEERAKDDKRMVLANQAYVEAKKA